MNQNIKPVQIGNRLVGHGEPTFIIAELGINHNGDLHEACAMIRRAKRCGADAVKFQRRTVPIVWDGLDKPREVHPDILRMAIARGVLSPEAVKRLQDSNFENSTNGDLKHALEFTADEYTKIAEFCKEENILWFASCWDEESVDFIDALNPVCYKIASPCLTDDNLLRHTRKTAKPIILSTGMSDLAMVEHAVEVLGPENLVLMQCTSYYAPAKSSDYGLHLLNISVMQTLEEKFQVPVGFSSHDTGIIPAYTAVVLGACTVEKHFTLWRGAVGSDQASSLEPGEFERMCRMIRELPTVRGDGIKRFYEEEKPASSKLRRKWTTRE